MLLESLLQPVEHASWLLYLFHSFVFLFNTIEMELLNQIKSYPHRGLWLAQLFFCHLSH